MNAELERMKNELLAAGYIIQLEGLLAKGRFEVTAPDGWRYVDNEAYQKGATLNEMIEINTMEAIEKAYARLREKRAYDTMVEFIQELASDNPSYALIADWIDGAKALLDSLPKKTE